MAETGTRIALCGMRCDFTATVLAVLAGSPGVDVRAVIVAGDGGSLPGLAAAGDVVTVPDRATLSAPSFRDRLRALAPHLVVVACFPWRLPAAVRAIPTHSALNIHPSLLPDGRGQEPVFWTFRRDERETGVTVHRLDAGFDTGPILARQRLPIPEGATIATLERDLARLGSTLVLDRLPAIRDGSADYTPQEREPDWVAPVPRPDDLVVPTGWPVRRAARFIRAVADTWGPLPVLVEGTGQRLAVRAVVAIEADTGAPAPVRIDGDLARIRFADGVLTCRLAIVAHRVDLT
jgi:methionyl-tRNA formyltransferase